MFLARLAVYKLINIQTHTVMRKFTYLIVLWDSEGNNLLETHSMSVRRVNEGTAKNIVRKTYPHPYFIELEKAKKV